MSHCFQDTSIFCALQFLQKFENSKWPPFLTGQILFENWVSYSVELSYRPKILLKSLYLARFSRYKHFCVLYFRKKFENSKWTPFLTNEIFLVTWKG